MYWYIGLYVKPFLPNPKDLPEVNHRRTGNRCQTCLPVGLKVIERVRGTQKHRPRLGASERKLAAL